MDITPGTESTTRGSLYESREQHQGQQRETGAPCGRGFQTQTHTAQPTNQPGSNTKDNMKTTARGVPTGLRQIHKTEAHQNN